MYTSGRAQCAFPQGPQRLSETHVCWMSTNTTTQESQAVLAASEGTDAVSLVSSVHLGSRFDGL